MTANDELMSNAPENEVPNDGQISASEQASVDEQAFADTQVIEGGQAFADAQPPVDDQAVTSEWPPVDAWSPMGDRPIDATQPLVDSQTFDATQPVVDGPAFADTQLMPPVSPEQPAVADSDAEALESLKRLEEQRKQTRRKRRIATIVACAVAFVLIGGWAISQMVQSSQGESAASTVVVKRTDLVSSVQTNGIVTPGSYVNVASQVPGIIQDVMVKDGQKVEAGAVLFTLKNSDIDKELEEAQIALSRANRDLSEAQAGVSDAKAEYAKAEKEYNDSVSEERAEERKAVAHAKKAYQETYDADIALIPSTATKQEKAKLTAAAKKDAQQAYDLIYAMESPGEIPEFDGSMYQASIDSANSTLVGAQEYVADLQRSYDSVLEESEKRTVRAPAAGTVLDLIATPGASVGFAQGGTSTAKSDTLAKIADLSKISVDVEVSEVDITAVKVGQRATLTFAGVPDLELIGRVSSVATVASNVSDDSSSSSFSDAVTFKVTVVADVSDDRLKPGMSTSVKIMTKDVPDVLVVPAGAVEEENGTSYVTVAKDEKAAETERREVVITDRTSREVAVSSGVKEGEIVIDRSANASKSSESPSSSSAR